MQTHLHTHACEHNHTHAHTEINKGQKRLDLVNELWKVDLTYHEPYVGSEDAVFEVSFVTFFSIQFKENKDHNNGYNFWKHPGESILDLGNQIKQSLKY